MPLDTGTMTLSYFTYAIQYVRQTVLKSFFAFGAKEQTCAQGWKLNL